MVKFYMVLSKGEGEPDYSAYPLSYTTSEAEGRDTLERYLVTGPDNIEYILGKFDGTTVVANGFGYKET